MAQIREVRLVDDLDGEHADETVTFGIDGTVYSIDLSADHAKALRESFADFIPAARKVGRMQVGEGRAAKRTTGQSAGRTSVDREQNQAVREWARAHGFELSDRGRIPAKVLEAYHQAA